MIIITFFFVCLQECKQRRLRPEGSSAESSGGGTSCLWCIRVCPDVAKVSIHLVYCQQFIPILFTRS